MPGPLHGYRVIDLTSMISGPLTTMILGDQGADVIKVENPAGGDHVRNTANRRGDFSAAFVNNNRNKRSVTIDLKRKSGRDLLLQLIKTADVFIQNFRPGVIERMGLGEPMVRAARADIVYVSISGFGERGPFADKPVYDPLVQALAGLTTIQAGSDTERPRLVRTILPDKLSAITTSQAITAALLARERTGRGQHVRLSMLDAVVAFLWSSDMGSQTFVGDELPQQSAASFIDLVYATADGHISVAVVSDRDWQALCRVIERPDLTDDPRFATAALRSQNINDRLEVTQAALQRFPTAEWLTRLDAESIPCAPVLTRNEMIEHPQLVANETVQIYPHEHAGQLRQARPAARFSETPSGVRRGAPVLGAHTDEVLRELDFDDDAIAELRAEGVIGEATDVPA